jgi:hypothetical protein
MILLKQISERSSKADIIIDTISQKLHEYSKVKVDNSRDVIHVIIWSKNNTEIDFTLQHFLTDKDQQVEIKPYIFDYIEYAKADIDGKINIIMDFCRNVYNLNENDISFYNKLYADINKAIEVDKKLRPPLPVANKKRKNKIQKMLKNYNKSLYSDFYKEDYRRLTENEN